MFVSHAVSPVDMREAYFVSGSISETREQREELPSGRSSGHILEDDRVQFSSVCDLHKF